MNLFVFWLIILICLYVNCINVSSTLLKNPIFFRWPWRVASQRVIVVGVYQQPPGQRDGPWPLVRRSRTWNRKVEKLRDVTHQYRSGVASQLSVGGWGIGIDNNVDGCHRQSGNISRHETFKPGVSNWRFVGLMRPANMVCAARDSDQNNEKI